MAFPLRLDPDLDAALTAHAARTGVPKVVTVRRAIERELGLDPEKRVRAAEGEEGREVAGRGGGIEVLPSDSRAESQAGSNGPSGSPPPSSRPATSSPKFRPDFKKGT